jgi:hypothetical protein
VDIYSYHCTYKAFSLFLGNFTCIICLNKGLIFICKIEILFVLNMGFGFPCCFFLIVQSSNELVEVET